MVRSQQQWQRGSQLLLLAAALALVLLIAAGSADAKCSTGYTDCNGKCYDLKSDPYNCNHCHNVCKKYPHTMPKCKWGECKWECDHLYGNCDGNIKNGCETNLSSDEHNCGSCHNGCKLSPDYKDGEFYCSGGKCYSRCKPGWKHNSAGKYCYH